MREPLRLPTMPSQPSAGMRVRGTLDLYLRLTDMKRVETRLIEAKDDLKKGRQVLRAAKRKVRAAKADRLDKDSAKRACKAIEKAVTFSEQRLDSLEKKSGGEKPGSRRSTSSRRRS
jgi:hypothetical protein